MSFNSSGTEDRLFMSGSCCMVPTCLLREATLCPQDDVCAALVDSGLKVFAYHGATDEEYAGHIEKCLEICSI